jgi:hypothetical protein
VTAPHPCIICGRPVPGSPHDYRSASITPSRCCSAACLEQARHNRIHLAQRAVRPDATTTTTNPEQSCVFT